MVNDPRIKQLIDEIRQRVDQLETAVAGRQAAAPAAGARARSARSAGTGLTQQAPGLPNVIPPTRTTDPDSIVGGRRTREFPDCCAVGSRLGYFCSGTLIASNLVVTAKHCEGVEQVFLKGYDVTRPATGETIAVTGQHSHPDDDVDLRVLVLGQNSSVTPRRVARGAEVRATRALLVGFGNIDFNGSFGYGVKRRVEVPIVSLGCSGPSDPSLYGCVAGQEIVAGHRGLARDSCTGDSGGPLYIRNATGGYSLLGATSRGLSTSATACGDGGIYVRVDLFLDWIESATGIRVAG
jgi:hypothetical protein